MGDRDWLGLLGTTRLGEGTEGFYLDLRGEDMGAKQDRGGDSPIEKSHDLQVLRGRKTSERVSLTSYSSLNGNF